MEEEKEKEKGLKSPLLSGEERGKRKDYKRSSHKKSGKVEEREKKESLQFAFGWEKRSLLLLLATLLSLCGVFLQT